MIIERKEYHQMTSTMTYDIEDAEIIEQFGDMESFLEHFYEETDEFNEFMMDFDYDREDDLWTDRKGGYEVEWEIPECEE